MLYLAANIPFSIEIYNFFAYYFTLSNYSTEKFGGLEKNAYLCRRRFRIHSIIN